ncbi:MAG: hypothetical protein AAB331_00125, partial [Planctomycetota bacterium]
PFWNGSLRQKCYPGYHSIMTKGTNPSPPDLFLNREPSLLEFQRRVLDEALDDGNPLLERLKYLAIFGSNMDEFFMVRVSGIRKQVEARIMEVFPDGLTPPDVLAATRKVRLSCMGMHCISSIKNWFQVSIKPVSICLIITS